MTAVAQSERIDILESSILAETERLNAIQLMIRFPPPGCRYRPVWRETKQAEASSLSEKIDAMRAELVTLHRQLSLAF